MNPHAPLEPQKFEAGTGRFRTCWQVTLNEDGTLDILATGVRAGHVHVRPEASNHLTVTTDRLIREGHPGDAGS